MPDGPYGSKPLPGSGAPGGVTPGGAYGFNSTQPVTPPGVTNGAGGSGFWGSLGGWLLDNWDKLASLGLGALTTREALQNAAKSDEFTNKALSMAEGDYANRGKFRTDAITKLGATRPDLSSIFADVGNPYKKGGLPVVGGAMPGAPGPFVPTPTVNGHPTGDDGMVPQIAPIGQAPSGPARPIPINPTPGSGPISAGPQNRGGTSTPSSGGVAWLPVDPNVPGQGPLTPGAPQGVYGENVWTIDPATGKRKQNIQPASRSLRVVGGY